MDEILLVVGIDQQLNRNFRFSTSDKDAIIPAPPLAQAVGAFPWFRLKLVHESGQIHRFVRAESLLRTVCGPFPTTPLHAPVSLEPIWKVPSRATILPVRPAPRSSAACFQKAGSSDGSPLTGDAQKAFTKGLEEKPLRRRDGI
jgi:hypothetical protein